MMAEPLSTHLGADLGADVSGIDLAEVSRHGRPEHVGEIRSLVQQYKVLRFRQQSLDPDALVRLAALFGPVRALKRARSSATHIADRPEIKVVSNVDESGRLLGEGGSSENAWHTDGSYLPRPTALTFLYGRKAPKREAPRTFVMDMQAIFDGLPERLVDLIRPLRAVHYSPVAYAPEFAAAIEALPKTADRRHIGPVHPLVRHDPVTGRASLFPPRQRACLIENWSVAESEKLSNVLWSVIETSTAFWGDSIERDDLVLFDNRFTMHRREPFLATEDRLLWHVTTDGEVPR